MTLTAKLLKQGYRYHKLRKAFSKFYNRHSELIVKYNIYLYWFKTLMQQGISEPICNGDLVYIFKRFVGNHNFSDQLKENVDVVVKNGAGEMSMSEEAKQNAWAEHYERLLNVEFDWDPDHLSNESPLEGQPIPITIDMVNKAISKRKSGKAAGPSGIEVEMNKAAGDTGVTMISDLATAITRNGKVSTG